MEWNNLPGNYEDFQQELENVGQIVKVLKCCIEEYHELEVFVSLHVQITYFCQIENYDKIQKWHIKYSDLFESGTLLGQPSTELFVRNTIYSLMSKLKNEEFHENFASDVKRNVQYGEKLLVYFNGI